MSIQTRALARRKASYIESEEFIPDTVLSPFTGICSLRENTRVVVVVAEVNVNRNQGFFTWGLGLLGMGTKKRKKS